jgi:hypothetical protein
MKSSIPPNLSAGSLISADLATRSVSERDWRWSGRLDHEFEMDLRETILGPVFAT